VGNQNLREFIKENKTVFIIIAIGLFLIELEIFALAAMKSGRKSWLRITDTRGVVIHETDGDNLSEFNKYYFERTFGPFENYGAKLEVQDRPFPFRAWFVAAIGVPLGAILLFCFVFNAFLSVFQIRQKSRSSGKILDPSDYSNKFDLIIDKISQMNIFIIGFLVFIAVIAYWIIPELISYIGKTGIDTIERFRWLFIFIFIAVILIGIWIIYLRYRLAKSSIESRTEIEKHRLKLQLDSGVYLLGLEDDNIKKKADTVKPSSVKINYK
jgi:hypothetical protein